MKKLLLILIALLLGMLFSIPTAASPSYDQPLEFISDIYQSSEVPTRPSQPSGRHTSTRANTVISPATLRTFLGESPLADYSDTILQSPYWSTIIGICWIEQYHCQHAPQNNYWGIGGASGLQRYANLEDGIQAISALLAKYEANGHDTIEELNGYYVQPASNNWLQTVITIKARVEGL